MSGLNPDRPAGLAACELRRRLQVGVTVAALALGAVGLGGVLCSAAVVTWHRQVSTAPAATGNPRAPGLARSEGIGPDTQLVRSSVVEDRPERRPPTAEAASASVAMQALVWGYGACVMALLLVLWPLARRQVAALGAALEAVEPARRGLAAPAPETGTEAEAAATPGPQALPPALAAVTVACAQARDGVRAAASHLDPWPLRAREHQGLVLAFEGLAHQAKVLALEATAEAARAGAPGQAFLGVADEVSGLSQRSLVATQRLRAWMARETVEIEAARLATTETALALAQAGRAVQALRLRQPGAAGAALAADSRPPGRAAGSGGVAPPVDALLTGSVEQLAAAVAALRSESLGIAPIQAGAAASERQGESVAGSTPARDLGSAHRASDLQHL